MRSRFAPSSKGHGSAAVSTTRRIPVIETLEGRQLMSAAISGNVYNDVNVNGVFKAGDPELAGVRVIRSLGVHPAGGELSQFLVNQRQQRRRILRRAVSGGVKKLSYINGGRASWERLLIHRQVRSRSNVSFGNRLRSVQAPIKAASNPGVFKTFFKHTC